MYYSLYGMKICRFVNSDVYNNDARGCNQGEKW